MLVVNERLSVPLREFRISFARSAGPGGQNVNKVNSKAVLRWSPAESPSLPDDVRRRLLSRYAHRLTSDGTLILTSQRFRDAGRNVADCLEKLRGMLADVARTPKPRKATRPSRGSVLRRLEQKRARSDQKRARHFRERD